MNWKEALAAIETVQKERYISKKLEQARAAACSRWAENYLYAHASGGEILADYLHERSVSADLNLTVCQPDNPPA